MNTLDYASRFSQTLDAIEKSENLVRNELKTIAKNLLHKRAVEQSYESTLTYYLNRGAAELGRQAARFAAQRLFGIVDNEAQKDVQNEIEVPGNEEAAKGEIFWSRIKHLEQEVDTSSARVLYRLIFRLSSSESIEQILESPAP